MSSVTVSVESAAMAMSEWNDVITQPSSARPAAGNRYQAPKAGAQAGED